jgi:hypothetical protein
VNAEVQVLYPRSVFPGTDITSCRAEWGGFAGISGFSRAHL